MKLCKCHIHNLIQNMLKRHGKIHWFFILCIPRISFDIWCFISIVISVLTLSDLYQNGFIEMPVSPVNSDYKLEERPILPEFDHYPDDIRAAIFEVYNITFKELATTRYRQQSPLFTLTTIFETYLCFTCCL